MPVLFACPGSILSRIYAPVKRWGSLKCQPKTRKYYAMPPRPLPLVPVQAAKKPKDVDPGIWALPQRLADAANQRGIGQQDLAKLSGVSQATISRWLHYAVAGIKVRDVMALEKVLGLPHGWLTAPTSVPATIRSIRSPNPTSIAQCVGDTQEYCEPTPIPPSSVVPSRPR
jgi:transcriptional regulator with XRE-family HTH domain